MGVMVTRATITITVVTSYPDCYSRLSTLGHASSLNTERLLVSGSPKTMRDHSLFHINAQVLAHWDMLQA